MGPHTTSDDPTRYRDAAEVEAWSQRDRSPGWRPTFVRGCARRLRPRRGGPRRRRPRRRRAAPRASARPPVRPRRCSTTCTPSRTRPGAAEGGVRRVTSRGSRSDRADPRFRDQRGPGESPRARREGPPHGRGHRRPGRRVPRHRRPAAALRCTAGRRHPRSRRGHRRHSRRLALRGYRPVVEIQFDGFVYPAFDQIVCQVAKLHYRSNGRIRMPLVIRIPWAGGVGAAEHHSESRGVLRPHRGTARGRPEHPAGRLRDAAAGGGIR